MAKKKPEHPLAPFVPTYAAARELSRLVGCTPSHVLNVVNGHKRPSLDLAARLSQITKLPIEAFLRKG